MALYMTLFVHQVKFVMHQERCKADEAKGRASETWQSVNRLPLEDVDGNARAVEHGLKYAAKDAAAYEARCLLKPAEEEARAAKAARTAVFHAEARKVLAAEEAAELAQRIESGELVQAKFYQTVPHVWAAVDENTEASHFWEKNVACQSWGGKLWVDKKHVFEAGVWALQPAAGGGFEWKTDAPSPTQTVAAQTVAAQTVAAQTVAAQTVAAQTVAAQTVAAAESRPEKKAKLQK
jgi:hypothetical protein